MDTSVDISMDIHIHGNHGGSRALAVNRPQLVELMLAITVKCCLHECAWSLALYLHFNVLVIGLTSSSAVANRPRNASCHHIFC